MDLLSLPADKFEEAARATLTALAGYVRPLLPILAGRRHASPARAALPVDVCTLTAERLSGCCGLQFQPRTGCQHSE